MVNKQGRGGVDGEYQDRAPTFEPNHSDQRRWKEVDPFGKPPYEPGCHLDKNKPQILRGLLEQFPRACAGVAEISAMGAEKYTWNGWESVPDGVGRFGESELRHILAQAEHQDNLPLRTLHAKQAAWNALARLELMLRSQ